MADAWIEAKAQLVPILAAAYPVAVGLLAVSQLAHDWEADLTSEPLTHPGDKRAFAAAQSGVHTRPDWPRVTRAAQQAADRTRLAKAVHGHMMAVQKAAWDADAQLGLMSSRLGEAPSAPDEALPRAPLAVPMDADDVGSHPAGDPAEGPDVLAAW